MYYMNILQDIKEMEKLYACDIFAVNCTQTHTHREMCTNTLF